MITGKTSNGFEYNIDERTLNDYEFVESIVLAENGENPTEKMTAVIKLAKYILGEEGKKTLLNKIKKENDGWVPQEKVYEEVFEIIHDIMKQNAKAKNS